MPTGRTGCAGGETSEELAGWFAVYGVGMAITMRRRQALGLLGLGTAVAMAGCGGGESTSPATRGDRQPGRPSDASGDEAGDEAGSLGALTVFKDPTCGCCGAWVRQAEEAGMVVSVEEQDDLPQVFADRRIPLELQSCHLAQSETGHLFVGHVPPRFVQDFLENPPAEGRGLSVPGMPTGSPGMEVGDSFEPYDVLMMTKNGAKLFARVDDPADQAPR